MDKFCRNVCRCTVKLLGVAAFIASVFAYVQIAHMRHCDADRTGKCGWAWCKHYDGSDRLHDFNF